MIVKEICSLLCSTTQLRSTDCLQQHFDSESVHSEARVMYIRCKSFDHRSEGYRQIWGKIAISRISPLSPFLYQWMSLPAASLGEAVLSSPVCWGGPVSCWVSLCRASPEGASGEASWLLGRETQGEGGGQRGRTEPGLL